LFIDSDGGTNQQITDLELSGTSGAIRTRTDADGSGASIITWGRSGTAVPALTFGPGAYDWLVEFGSAAVTASFGAVTGGGLAINAMDASDGSNATFFLSGDGGSSYLYAVALPAATTNALVSGGPTGAHSVLDVGGGPLVLSVAFTAIGSFDAARWDSYVPVRVPRYTVAGLPAGAQGDRAMVTNALGPAFGAAVVGGGAVVVPVYHDGTNWKVG
jgi:hypothetical protein